MGPNTSHASSKSTIAANGNGPVRIELHQQPTLSLDRPTRYGPTISSPRSQRATIDGSIRQVSKTDLPTRYSSTDNRPASQLETSQQTRTNMNASNLTGRNIT